MALWILLIFLTMYAARKPFLRAILRLSRLFYNSLRLASTSVKLAEKRLHIRNRTVLMGSELEAGERRIEREFERIGQEFQHHVKGFSQIQRKLMEDLIKGEEDYQNCAEVPQVLPDWGKVIDAVAKIKPSGDPAVADILELIHHTLIEQHKTALESHRRSVSARHALLGKMVPFWRNIQKTMRGVETQMADLHQRSKKIDRYMEEHEKVLKRSDAVERLLTSSTLVKFLISSGLLAVAGLAAFVNYNLIAMPMGELVGADSYIGSIKMSDLYSFIIVSLEVVLGLFIMDGAASYTVLDCRHHGRTQAQMGAGDFMLQSTSAGTARDRAGVAVGAYCDPSDGAATDVVRRKQPDRDRQSSDDRSNDHGIHSACAAYLCRHSPGNLHLLDAEHNRYGCRMEPAGTRIFIEASRKPCHTGR